MKTRKSVLISRAVAATLTGAVTFSMFMPARALGDAPNTPKEEVVYVNLNMDGSVKEINVVNIFDLEQNAQIVDYGSYSSLRNMTRNYPLNYSNETVTIDAEAGKLYYEGKLSGNVMPWNISLHYYMNGVEYSSNEIVGMSGQLKIHIQITQNSECRGNFYSGYALQGSLTFDTDKCKDISADGATIANVGKDKQLTYIILPGKGIDTEISASVTDFEMGSISLNGIPLNLNVDVNEDELISEITDLQDALTALSDGTNELDSGVKELQDGVKGTLKSGTSEINSGAYDLQNGALRLKDGTTALNNGAAELNNGAGALDDGIRSLNNGVGQIQTALDTLNVQSSALRNGSASFKAALTQLGSALGGVSIKTQELSMLTDASKQVKDGIDRIVDASKALQTSVSYDAYKALMSQNGLNIDDLKQKNSESVTAIQGMIASLNDQITVLSQTGADTSGLSKQVEQLEGIAALLNANNAAIDGTGTYLDTLNKNIGTLVEGASTLQTNYATFDQTIQALVGTLGDLVDKTTELSTAVNTLVSEYEKLDSGIAPYTDGVAQITAGYSQITDGASQLLTGSGALKSGTDELYNGTGALLTGINELYDGAGTLKDGTGALDKGVSELVSNIARLYNGTHELKDGASTLHEKTAGMDTKITDKIDEMLDDITGGDHTTESFTSEKNTNIESVQFVIKTDELTVPEEAAPASADKPELTFWQKLLKLFGLYHE